MTHSYFLKEVPGATIRRADHITEDALRKPFHVLNTKRLVEIALFERLDIIPVQIIGSRQPSVGVAFPNNAPELKKMSLLSAIKHRLFFVPMNQAVKGMMIGRTAFDVIVFPETEWTKEFNKHLSEFAI
jgi:hypothetical protein